MLEVEGLKFSLVTTMVTYDRGHNFKWQTQEGNAREKQVWANFMTTHCHIATVQLSSLRSNLPS